MNHCLAFLWKYYVECERLVGPFSGAHACRIPDDRSECLKYRGSKNIGGIRQEPEQNSRARAGAKKHETRARAEADIIEAVAKSQSRSQNYGGMRQEPERNSRARAGAKILKA
uniref:COX assembly mitochondrial protein n=1 Tax=Ditylenchus dipsaci TaxID=166011 RepID=A0A915DYQ1_9BILA